ncbi:MAG: Acyl carrier protein [Candidatus Amesbacteria bacterium GW2011_GWA2_47_11b]|uniref:Acyl carrier protein n=3 Tax=Candidatus Amesiibacteriota TaxID=1752730 RepID=A0A0G1UNC2_9BACT|nr:MAG: Acyl carrier protein [Microgenomates group bacterium GW2011_GWC1_46_20]KKU57834.1 MAG: Acyl carrier protein [Candidatus Amesbacteria bacterium GW2011_GWA2_47_11b]KKU67583.1 MAG: Acyl carrier protein [Candidatus Amesbacteria bacterium GW2011_GWA1_47_20]KKU82720.1 MAG: Acyl carrier protein [Candidatus Amesbacteria bacterium GW2011_GWC2_47_8]
MQIKTAIIQFLANEFQLDPDHLNPDTAFTTDLGLSPEQLTNLLQRLQESLGIILPEDKLPTITTIGQLLDIFEEDDTPL